MNLMNDTKTPTRQPVLTPVQPSPQTVQGILEHTGNGLDGEDIKDVPLSFNFLNSIPYYLTKFQVRNTMTVGSQVYTFNVYQDSSCIKTSTNASPPWVGMPMLGSTYFNGAPKFRMFAVKPSRTPCKLLVEFWYCPGNIGDEPATRIPLREWDLQESPVCEFEIPGAYILRDKMSAIPSMKPLTQASYIAPGYITPIQMYEAGKIRISLAMPYQPGSLFPDDYYIYVEKSWPTTVFKIPNSYRGDFENILQSALR